MIRFNTATIHTMDLDVNNINIKISRMCNGYTKTVVSDLDGKEIHKSMDLSRVVDFGEKMNEMLNIYCNDKQIKSKGDEDELQTKKGVDKKQKQ